MKILLKIFFTVILIFIASIILTLLATGFVDGLIWISSLLGSQHSLGIDTQMSKNYDSVSGYLPIVVASLGFSGILVTAWHHFNCGAPVCWKIGTHHYIDKNGKRHILCHEHDIYKHPKGPHWWSKRKGHSLEEIHSMIGKPKIAPQ